MIKVDHVVVLTEDELHTQLIAAYQRGRADVLGAVEAHQPRVVVAGCALAPPRRQQTEHPAPFGFDPKQDMPA